MNSFILFLLLLTSFTYVSTAPDIRKSSNTAIKEQHNEILSIEEENYVLPLVDPEISRIKRSYEHSHNKKHSENHYSKKKHNYNNKSTRQRYRKNFFKNRPKKGKSYKGKQVKPKNFAEDVATVTGTVKQVVDVVGGITTLIGGLVGKS